MPDYSLVPVDYQPDFDDYSLVPVDHDPFAADDIIQRARTQQKSQPQPLANGTGQPNVGAPANNAQAAVADASYNPNSVSGGGSYGGGMADYSLIPVDYQPDFGDYSLVPVDYDPFIADDIIQRTRTQLASQPQPDAGFDQPPSAPQTPGSAPPLSPIVPNDGQAPSVPQPPGQDLHSQYQALRPMLGDRNAMLATAYPEVRQTLIAQALAGQQQPGQTSEPAPTGGVSGVTQQAQTQTQTQPAQPQPQTQPQQPATGAGQPATEGGVTVTNLDTGSADLRTIPGVSAYADDAANEAAGEGVLAGPNGKRFDTIEKLPGSDTANDQHTVGISGKNITDLGNGSFQVTNGQITIKTVSENGTTTFTTYDIRGNSYAIVSQPPNGGPISVKVGSASN
jgi:hypothetical protein